MLLKGTKVKFKTRADVISLLDKDVVYLENEDIDKSGRGYFYPRFGQIRDYWKKQVNISGSWIYLSNIKEIVLNEGQYEQN